MSETAYILSYGRADHLITHDQLRKQGYTGDIRVVVGTDDPQLDEYERLFGDELRVFDKSDYQDVDTCDNLHIQDIVLYARHAVFDIARKDGVSRFILLDDDYNRFDLRTIEGRHLAARPIEDLDAAFSASFDFLESTPCEAFAWAQVGDLLGGVRGMTFQKGLLRKVMNVYFLHTDAPLDFVGSTNEDMTYSLNATMRGTFIASFTPWTVVQTETQAQQKGLTDVYLRYGTYVKSFYTVMNQPSCCRISTMGQSHRRIHHHVNWKHCAPKILNEKWKK